MTSRSILFRVGAAVAIGALTSITVAWSCVVFAPDRHPREFVIQHGDLPAGAGWGTPSRYWVVKAVGYRQTLTSVMGASQRYQDELRRPKDDRRFDCREPFDECVVFEESQSGWPLPCLHSSTVNKQIGESPLPAFAPSGGKAERGVPVPKMLANATNSSRRIPLVPMWAGLAGNTGIFGCLLLGCFLVRPVRGWARTRRGLCATCGYACESFERCPECGARRESSPGPGGIP